MKFGIFYEHQLPRPWDEHSEYRLLQSSLEYRLAEEEIGRGAGLAGPHETNGAGRRASLYLLFFPTAVFLVAPYSESLFLAGAIPAFYYARRKRWIMAGMFAAVAMGARAAGIFLLFGLLVEFVRQPTSVVPVSDGQ